MNNNYKVVYEDKRGVEQFICFDCTMTKSEAVYQANDFRLMGYKNVRIEVLTEEDRKQYGAA